MYFFPFAVLSAVEGFAQDSCNIRWQDAIQISPNNTSAYTLKMAAQGDTIYLTYQDDNGFIVPFTVSTNGELSWQCVKEILTDTIEYHGAYVSYIAPNSRYVFLWHH